MVFFSTIAIVDIKKRGLRLFFGNEKAFNLGINTHSRKATHHNHKP
jgi:hypothetical protein